MLSCLQKRDKMHKVIYAHIVRELLLGDMCKYIFHQISKVAIGFPFASGREGRKQRNDI